MDDIQKQKLKKCAEIHCQQLDNIIKEIVDELNIYDPTPELINDISLLALEKWKFLYKHNFL